MLGTRWFARARGPQRPLRWQRVLAAAVAVFVAVIAVTLWQANDDRADRARAQEPHPTVRETTSFLVRQVDAPYDGDVWSTIFVTAETSDPPAPPGLRVFPAPGEVWVSPAVQRLVDDHDPSVARLPGPVTGIIADVGLQSPDQLFVLVGTSGGGPGWWRAQGWGADVEATTRPAVPRWPMLGLLIVLVGLPALVLVRGTARMAIEARERDLAGLHLLGVPRVLLARAAAADAAWCALTGGVAGGSAAVALASVAHGTRVLGYSWFQPGWPHQIFVVAVVLVVASAVVWWDVARLSLRSLSDPWGARANRPQAWRWWRLVPLALGLSLLVAVVVPYLVVGTRYGSSLTSSYFFTGSLLGLLGAVTGLASLMDWWSRRVGHRDSSASGLLGSRRLRWERERIATAVSYTHLTLPTNREV